MYKHLQL